MESEELKQQKRLAQVLHDVFGIALPVIALTISIISLTISARMNRKTALSAAMRAEYTDLYEITKLGINNPEQSHLFAVATDYAQVVQRVKLMAAPLTEGKRHRLLMQERGMANLIFTSFAETVAYHNLAVKNRDDELASILKVLLESYVERIMDNPRLLYYWAQEAGDLTIEVAADAKDYYQPKLEKALESGESRADATGPYGDP